MIKLWKSITIIYNHLKADIANYNKDNISEQRVIESHYFSAYRGKLVLRIPGKRSGSFGILFMVRDLKNRTFAEDEVRHEYGHTIQLKQLGVWKYLICIGIPSLLQWGSGSYYDKPWEITADDFGDVRYRRHLKRHLDRGYQYLRDSRKQGIRIWKRIR